MLHREIISANYEKVSNINIMIRLGRFWLAEILILIQLYYETKYTLYIIHTISKLIQGHSSLEANMVLGTVRRTPLDLRLKISSLF